MVSWYRDSEPSWDYRTDDVCCAHPSYAHIRRPTVALLYESRDCFLDVDWAHRILPQTASFSALAKKNPPAIETEGIFLVAGARYRYALPLACNKNTFGAFVTTLRFTVPATILLMQKSQVQIMPSPLAKKNTLPVKGKAFFLVAGARFELATSWL